jgi:TonB family protein
MRSAILSLLVLALPSTGAAQTTQPQSRPIPSAFLWQESADVRSGLPDYPPAAVAEKRDATVEVELVIGTDGRILHARLAKSGGDLFDAATMPAMRSWRFSPA